MANWMQEEQDAWELKMVSDAMLVYYFFDCLEEFNAKLEIANLLLIDVKVKITGY